MSRRPITSAVAAPLGGQTAVRPPALAFRGLVARLASLSAAGWLLVLVAPVGLFLVFAVPPFQGLDEPNHFFRVYSISGGALVQPTRDGHIGADVPACAVAYASTLYGKAQRPEAFRPAEFLATPAGCDARASQFVPIENTALYSAVSYLPQSVGVAVARALGGSIPVVFYSGRLAGLLGYLALVYLALRLAPRGRLVLLVVAAMPMALLLGAVYSADGMTIALALLLIACVLRCCFDPNATWRDFALATVVATALALSKTAYGVMALLLLLAPARLFVSKRASWVIRAAAVSGACLVGLAWLAVIWQGWYDPSTPLKGVNASGQLRSILDHPRAYSKFVADTLLGPRTGYFTWPGFVSWVGFSRSPAAGSPAPPPLIMVLGFILLVQAWMRVAPPPFTWSRSAPLRAALPLVPLLAVPVIIVTSLYLTSSLVGAQVSWGFQGRYFLPLAALPAVSLCMLTSGRPQRRSLLPLIPLVLVLLAYLVVKVLTYFY